MALPNQTQANSHAEFYGIGPHRILNQTLLGGGAAALTFPGVSATAGAVQPCAVEILSCVRTTTGSYALTFSGNHYAIASWTVSVDDVNAATPVKGYLGQFANLGTGTPMTCQLSTYVGAASADVATDVALATPVRIQIWFKDDNSGPVA